MSALIGLTGGIGAGKSVVSRLLRLQGHAVYDCDREARILMDASEHVRSELSARWGDDIYGADGVLDRARVARYVFGDLREKQWLDALVHGMVRDDVRRFAASGGKESVMFVESAILYGSGLWRQCAEVWRVTAPEDVRIARVRRRSGLGSDEAMARIRAQEEETALADACDVPLREIDNGGDASVMEQVGFLLTNFKTRI